MTTIRGVSAFSSSDRRLCRPAAGRASTNTIAIGDAKRGVLVAREVGEAGCR